MFSISLSAQRLLKKSLILRALWPLSVCVLGAYFLPPQKVQAQEVGSTHVEPPLVLQNQGPLLSILTADPEWHLKRVRAFDGWSLFADRGKIPGEGVVIAIPDTGYSFHPELAIKTTDDSPILYHRGYDFLNNDDNPFDDTAITFGKSPGHGTQLASLIVSPRGPDGVGPRVGPWVTGIAPGARVIPYRVSESVIIFDSGPLIRAIRKATAERVDIINICSGRWPSAALEEAINEASAQGTIVIAAAGNEVGLVVWPAAYDKVIAVAATRADDKPWTHSSRGRKVSLSAPGADVWIAHSRPSPLGEGFMVAHGSGTSMATALTSGSVALWLSWHGPDVLAARYGRENIPKVLRWIIDQGYATRAPRGWNSAHFGTGILDVERLLRAPLPELSEMN